MSRRCHPTPQRLCPLSPWVGQRRPQILAPHLPMGPLQAPGTGFMHATASSLVWDEFLIHIKKKRGGGGVGLRWPPFSKYIQQSNGSWHLWCFIYWGGRAAGVERTGGHSTIVLAVQLIDKNTIKKNTSWP
jgi:hypothetical protein